MGWASYFEDVVRRHDESTVIITGLPGPPPSGIASRLRAAESQLRELFEEVTPDVVRSYEEGAWLELADEMERLEQQLSRFDIVTLMAGESGLLHEAGSLMSQVTAVLARAAAVAAFLDSRVRPLFVELEAIRRLRQEQPHLRGSAELLDIEERVVWLFHGHRALVEQLRDLKQRAGQLELQMGGKVFERLMTLTSDVPDKDSKD